MAHSLSVKGNKIDDLKRLAKDLRQEQPRSPDEPLGGFKGAARLVDLGRAALLGWEGEYPFGQPADRELALVSPASKAAKLPREVLLGIALGLVLGLAVGIGLAIALLRRRQLARHAEAA